MRNPNENDEHINKLPYMKVVKLLDFCQRQIRKSCKNLAEETSRNNEIARQIGAYGIFVVRPETSDSQASVYTEILMNYSNMKIISDGRVAQLRTRLVKYKQLEQKYKQRKRVILDEK